MSLKTQAATTFATKFNNGFAAGLQRFQILMLAATIGVTLYILGLGLENRYSLTEKQEKIVKWVKEPALHLAYTLLIYMTLVAYVYGETLAVKGAV